MKITRKAKRASVIGTLIVIAIFAETSWYDYHKFGFAPGAFQIISVLIGSVICGLVLGGIVALLEGIGRSSD